MANDKFSYLSGIRALAKSLRDQLCPAQTATLVKAATALYELCAYSGQCEKSNQPLSKAFDKGIASVIQDLLAFQSGYASNDPSQQIDPAAEPGFAPTNTVKSATTEKRISLGEFGALAKGVLSELNSQPVHEAIKALDGLVRIIDKAVLDTDATSVLVPATAPAVVKEETAPAAVVAPAVVKEETPAPAAVVAPAVVKEETTAPAAVVAPAVVKTETAAPAAVAPPSIEELEKAGKKAPKSAGWPLDCNSPEFLGR
jgi:hypothetical protein